MSSKFQGNWHWQLPFPPGTLSKGPKRGSLVGMIYTRFGPATPHPSPSTRQRCRCACGRDREACDAAHGQDSFSTDRFEGR